MVSLTDLTERQGARIRVTVQNTGFAVGVLFHALSRVVPDAWHRRAFIRDQFIVCGIGPLPVVAVVGMFTGMLLALQMGIELMAYGQGEAISNMLGVILFREMGPFMTAMILTASVGSAMAAEIGTMAVSEELDALDCMSIDSVSFLVMPRIIALSLSAPLLSFLACVVGIAGGGLVAATQIDIPYDVYFRNVRESLVAEAGFGGWPEEIYTGLMKSVVFGALIATISCACGLRATGGALGVGRSVRRAVVVSFLLIMILGYFLSWAFFR